MNLFNEQGELVEGLHKLTTDEFLALFCEGSIRSNYKTTIVDLRQKALHAGASYFLVGGSFVSKKEDPNDIDIVIVFPRYDLVPRFNQSVLVAEIELDILVCCLQDEKTVSAFSALLAHDQFGKRKGVIRIDLLSGIKGEINIYSFDESEYEFVKAAYTSKRLINRSSKKGILVTIHGILSYGVWNYILTPIANEQNWIVAPFHYGNTLPTVLFCSRQREKIKDQFRHWLFDIYSTYGGRYCISIVAHSFGTWLVSAYFHDFKSSTPPVTVQSIIFAGSILNPNIKWDEFENHIGIIRNEIGLSDGWVKKVPACWYPGKDKLFGQAGLKGFSNESKILTQERTEGISHNNSIEKDIIQSRWLPFLNANRLCLENRKFDNLRNKF